MRRCFACLVLVPTLAAAGCLDAKTDYGAPSDSTKIDLVEDGGFAPPGVAGREVHIAGGDVRFVNASQSGVGLIDAAHVQLVIDDLANVHFLKLRADWTTCQNAASDAPTADISAELDAAGSNAIHVYRGCSGGEFDLLAQLEDRILEDSGFTAWAMPSAGPGSDTLGGTK